MIKLVSFKNCPFVQRVMGALVMKNVPFEIEYIELNNKPQWFLDISPNGQVPVLITENETVLFESDAIVEYLDDKYAPIERSVCRAKGTRSCLVLSGKQTLHAAMWNHGQ